VLGYREWLKRALEAGTELHAMVGFDLVHHLRGDSFREPGYLWRLPLPFVWGPTGGYRGVPFCLMAGMDFKNIVLHTLRNLISEWQFRFSARVSAAASKASSVLVQTPFEHLRFAERYGPKVMLVHERGADPSHSILRAYGGDRPLKVAWAGRCVSLKGLPILLRALSKARPRVGVELHLAGDGPMLTRWRQLAERLGVDRQCLWHGWLSHEETWRMISQCDVLAFPSLIEGTADTIMQALSAGIPVITFEQDLVDNTWCVPIPVKDISSAIQGFAGAIVQLAENPIEVGRLCGGAHKKAREYSWDHVACQVNEAYQKAVAHRELAPPMSVA